MKSEKFDVYGHLDFISRYTCSEFIALRNVIGKHVKSNSYINWRHAAG